MSTTAMPPPGIAARHSRSDGANRWVAIYWCELYLAPRPDASWLPSRPLPLRSGPSQYRQTTHRGPETDRHAVDAPRCWALNTEVTLAQKVTLAPGNSTDFEGHSCAGNKAFNTFRLGLCLFATTSGRSAKGPQRKELPLLVEQMECSDETRSIGATCAADVLCFGGLMFFGPHKPPSAARWVGPAWTSRGAPVRCLSRTTRCIRPTAGSQRQRLLQHGPTDHGRRMRLAAGLVVGAQRRADGGPRGAARRCPCGDGQPAAFPCRRRGGCAICVTRRTWSHTFRRIGATISYAGHRLSRSPARESGRGGCNPDRRVPVACSVSRPVTDAEYLKVRKHRAAALDRGDLTATSTSSMAE
jgi:hypothetical protein